jgi:Protein of unknown function (DUF4230)
MSRNLMLSIIALVLAFALGIYAMRWWNNLTQPKSTESSQVLLERIKSVSKIITTEGYFSEIYEHSSYWGYDISIFRKKALVKVKAKVSAGFDLSNMKMEVDEASKTIFIKNIGEAHILSIDHDLSYYDVAEGTFNAFKPEDYNLIQAKAKEFIKQQAEKSGLLQSAKEQGSRSFDMMRLTAENMGWKCRIEGLDSPTPNASPDAMMQGVKKDSIQ